MAVRENEASLENVRAWRWGAVCRAYEEGFHPLDVAALARVERRTARDWRARWLALRADSDTREQASDQAQREKTPPDLAS